jgi:nucleotide-binding universal stress UspA family protein
MTVVVFATDSPEGAGAVSWALANRSSGDEHLHVVLSRSDVPGKIGHASFSAVARLEEELAASGGGHTIHRDEAEPADAALDLAVRHDARWLVVGVRGRSSAMKFVLGSHVQYLLRNADRPVVCVKRPDDT